MIERPMIFSGASIKAIMSGAKTQTRRVCNPQPPSPELVKKLSGCGYGFCYTAGAFRPTGPVWCVRQFDASVANNGIQCRHGMPGDRIWCREGIQYNNEHDNYYYTADDAGVGFNTYVALKRAGSANINPIFMPRFAARLVLEITSVYLQQLHDITEEDAIAEGVDAISMDDIPRQATLRRRDDFAQLWNMINGKKWPWSSNPWTWKIQFRKVS